MPAPVPTGRAAKLQRQLRNLEVFVTATGDEMRIDVPPEAQRLLRDFKDALLDSLDRVLPGALNKLEPTQALQEAMVGEGLDWAASNDWSERAIDGSIEPVPKHSGRWLATLCILLAPGSDCMIVVYEHRQGRLQQALVVRSDMYTSIEGALHALTWAISPPDADDGFYLLEAHTHPWPASRWRSFSYRALAPSGTAEKPLVLAEASASGNWENGFGLDARSDRFTVTYDVWSDRGPDFQATKVHTWARHQDRFRPITPGVKSAPNLTKIAP
jgi:hypothetical protein